MLEINKLCIQAQSGKLLLDSINIKLNPGEVIGITGHSGSGKQL